MDQRVSRLVEECERESEACLYTSTMLFIWLRWARTLNTAMLITPIILGAIGSWSVLERFENPRIVWLTAIAALAAGVIPAVYSAIKLDVHLDGLRRDAAEFKNLQDRFRQAATITSLGSYEEFKEEFDVLKLRLEDARRSAPTPPERFYEAARRKIERGDYAFSVDTSRERL